MNVARILCGSGGSALDESYPNRALGALVERGELRSRRSSSPCQQFEHVVRRFSPVPILQPSWFTSSYALFSRPKASTDYQLVTAGK